MEERRPETVLRGWEAVGFVGEVFLAVAIPTTICALLGRWLDKAYGWSPWATLVGLILSVVLSFVLVLRKAKSYQRSV
jgi:F0F1-type ATP synthase assembly protein I